MLPTSFRRHELSFCFSIGGPKFFLKVTVTMISQRFVKMSITAYYWVEYGRKYEVKITRITLSFLFTHLLKNAGRTRAWNQKYFGNLSKSLSLRTTVIDETLLGPTQGRIARHFTRLEIFHNNFACHFSNWDYSMSNSISPATSKISFLRP